MELQGLAQAEAQRRATQSSRLALVLPAHVLDVLTLGNLPGVDCDQRHCLGMTPKKTSLENESLFFFNYFVP